MNKILICISLCFFENIIAQTNPNGIDLKSLDIDIGNEDYENAEDNLNQTYQVVIDPLYRTKLYAEIQSPVVKINQRMGESFKKGDVLIQLDDRITKSNLSKALSSLDKAQVEYDGKKQLYHENVASLFELKEAEANVAIAKAEVAVAERDFDATTIKAPYDGKVVSLNVEEYELPRSGTELIEIVKDTTLLAELLVPSQLLKKIKIGDTFKVYLHNEENPVYAKIKRIGSVIDPSSDTIKIEAEIDNKKGNLKSGMTGRADFEDIKEVSVPVKNNHLNRNFPKYQEKIIRPSQLKENKEQGNSFEFNNDANLKKLNDERQ